jgi:hypothetical protein
MIIHFVEQSSRFHLKTTTLRDEGIKTNTDGFPGSIQPIKCLFIKSKDNKSIGKLYIVWKHAP